jgi:hypothetical protein
VSIVGSTEPDWECTGYDDIKTVIEHPATQSKCDQMKQCRSLTAIKNSTEFNSIVATFQLGKSFSLAISTSYMLLVCDDADKPEKIQIIQAAALVCYLYTH